MSRTDRIKKKEKSYPQLVPIAFLIVLLVFFVSICIVKIAYVAENQLGIKNDFFDYVIATHVETIEEDDSDLDDEDDTADQTTNTTTNGTAAANTDQATTDGTDEATTDQTTGTTSEEAADGTADNSADSSSDTKATASFAKRDIDWAALYPFKDGKSKTVETKSDSKTGIGFIDAFKTWMDSVVSDVDKYTSTARLSYYDDMVASAKEYENSIGSYTSYAEYNGVVKMDDGYLTSYIASIDDDTLDSVSSSLIDLKKFCDKQNTDFLYVMAPYKVSKYEDTEISGTLDFSNQNADEFLSRIGDAGVDYLDLRENIEQEGLHNHALFYRTDHHWLSQTGLWATKKIYEYLDKNNGFKVDTSIFDDSNFTFDVMKGVFLGSLGKKVTLAETTPDDFTYYYPNFDTQFHYVVPVMRVNKTGDYTIMYNQNRLEGIDYYKKNQYHSLNYGDQPYNKIVNLNFTGHKKHNRILFIHDSFGLAVMSNLALGVRRVDAIDMRYFTGSLETFIEDTQPDLVIVLYNAGHLDPNMSDTSRFLWNFN